MVRRTIALLAALASLAATAALAAPAGAASDGFWDYRPIGINGTYQTIAGYFNGDDLTDILFYAPGTVGDSIWFGRNGVRGATGFTKKNLSVNGS